MVVGAGIVLATCGAAWGVVKVLSRERGELEVRSAPHALGEAHEGALVLGGARLLAGDDVLFETCADDPLSAARWAGAVDAVVWAPDVAPGTVSDDAFALRIPLDAATLASASRDAHGACVQIGHAESLGAGGTFTVGLLVHGDAAMAHERTRFIAHVIALRPAPANDSLPLLLVLVGSFIAALAFALRTAIAPTGESVSRRSATVRAVVGGVALAAAIAATALVPFGGATVALVVALVLATTEIGLAVGLAARAAGELHADTLALSAMKKWRAQAGSDPRTSAATRWIGVAATPFLGVALLFLGFRLQMAIDAGLPPPNAAIEAFVRWPSAALAVALVAVVAPVAEELFFRGFLYGSLSRGVGSVAAFVVTAVLFWAAHAPQDWGDPGALASLALVSLALTTLRATTGSTALCILVHLAHNAALALAR